MSKRPYKSYCQYYNNSNISKPKSSYYRQKQNERIRDLAKNYVVNPTANVVDYRLMATHDTSPPSYVDDEMNYDNSILNNTDQENITVNQIKLIFFLYFIRENLLVKRLNKLYNFLNY